MSISAVRRVTQLYIYMYTHTHTHICFFTLFSIVIYQDLVVFKILIPFGTTGLAFSFCPGFWAVAYFGCWLTGSYS